MTTWDVKFRYNITIEADTKEEARQKASEQWNEYAPMANEIDIDVTEPKDDNDTKTIRISGHDIEYCYHDDFDGVMNDCDIEHITKLIENGYREGELVTSDPNPSPTTIDGDHYGWWKIP